MIKMLIAFLFCVSSSVAFSAMSEKQLLSSARKNFEQKKFEEALKDYEQIPASSDRYLLVLEEKAWTYIHLDQMNKALAAARTLTSPALNGLTSIEPFLLRSLVLLKICDYVGVFQTLKDFKTQKKEQIIEIQNLAQNGVNSISQGALQQWMNNPEDWKSLKTQLGKLPQLFYHDKIMLQAAHKKDIVRLKKRLQELAIVENNENHRILQKLNLIEIESVQRVHIATQFNDRQGKTLDKSQDDLVFKDSRDDVWLDELDSYQATIDRCEKKSGRTM